MVPIDPPDAAEASPGDHAPEVGPAVPPVAVPDTDSAPAEAPETGTLEVEAPEPGADLPDPGRPWTEEDCQEAFERHRGGMAPAEVARWLNRDPKQVENLLRVRGRRDGAAAPPEAEAEAAPLPEEPEPEPEPREPAPEPEPNPCDVADETGWTPREDLELLERFTAGEKSYAIARAMPGRNAPGIVRRFRQLVPVPGAVNQARALERQRARVAEVDAAMKAAE